MRKLTTLLLAFAMVLNSMDLTAQAHHFYNLNTIEGFNLNTVLSLYQDERNYIWIGTQNGAGVYHGGELTLFKHDKTDPESLPSNEIKQITGDRNGHIYIRTGSKGIVRYDISTARFKPLVASSVNHIHYNEGLYYSTASAVYRLHEETGISELLYSFENMEMTISAIYSDGPRLYIGTYGNGVYVLENHNLRQLVNKGYINEIFKDSKGLFWLTSVYGDGIYVLDGDRILNYRYDPRDPHSISCDKTHRCCEDKNGNIWIGTFNGLNRFDRETGTFTRYNSSDFSENSITSVLCDHQGTIWAATYYFGLYFFNPESQYYQIYRQGFSGKDGLSSPVVSRIIEDDNGNLWIGTSKGGLNRYDRQTGEFKWYRKTGSYNEISSDNIKSLYFDRKNNCLWIGTHLGGLDRLNLHSGRFYHYQHVPGNPNSLPSNIISDIVPYGNRLILAAKGNISVFNPYNGTCKPLFDNPDYVTLTGHCNQLLIDRKGRLWMAHTSSGAFCYDLNTEKMMIFRNENNLPGGISSGRVNHMYEDSKGRIWFCNNQNGLDRYDEEAGKFVNYDVENCGIASNTVYALCEISEDRFILTTDTGYSILEYDTKASSNFINNQNSPLSSANEKCLLRTSDGNIFIGGMNGMISFNENNLKSVNRPYNILPCRLTVDGVQIRPGDDSDILREDLSRVHDIRLRPKVSSIVLKYAVTDYLPYDKDRILYRLENYTDDWAVLDDSREISFSRLPPGKYTLVVKSEPAGGTCQESRLGIIVITPFYKTVWAIALYVLLSVSLIFIILKTYRNHVHLQETVLFEQEQTRRVKELNQYKLSFFTNISHEFRTPLTIIIAQIELLMENNSFDKHTHSSLNRIYRNCVLLKDLISELLDFRKQEQGYMKIKVSEHNIVSYINDLFSNFQSYAKKKNITYKFFKIYDDIEVWFDQKQLQKAVNNLIFNAFRFVSENGRITVSVNKEGGNVLIDVINTGHGIKKEDRERIFDSFYQTDTSYAGTGIGLALAKGIVEQHGGKIEVASEPEKETMFRIILPLGYKHFKPEQLQSIASANEAGQLASADKAMPVETALLLGEDETPETGNDLALQETSAVADEGADSRRTVLVVEDSNSLRETLIQLFTPFYNVIAASEGDQAYELALKVGPDLVVSDIMIPNLSGLELCRKLKSNEDTSVIPVVLLSAKADDAQKIEGFKYGADDYIVKPFNNKLLVSRCNNLVNSRMTLKKRFLQVKASEPQHVMANSENDKKFLLKATDIVKKHIEDNDFNIEVLARELGVSRTKLFTRIKDILGATPLEFIMNIKIDEAAKMLKTNNELNISEISDRAGFSSPKYFRKYFKNKYGMTPQEYRNS